MFVKRISEMVSFELRKEKEKDDFSSCLQRGKNKKTMRPHE